MTSLKLNSPVGAMANLADCWLAGLACHHLQPHRRTWCVFCATVLHLCLNVSFFERSLRASYSGVGAPAREAVDVGGH